MNDLNTLSHHGLNGIDDIEVHESINELKK